MTTATLEWILIRSTGLTAVVALTASMVLGLMLSLRMRSPRWPAIVTNDLHRFVTGLALWTVAAHVVLLLVDGFANVSLVDLVIPFGMPDQPVANGLGTIALVLLVVVWVTSVNRRAIGARTWRRLHGLTFVLYVAAMAHGLFAGTDTSRPWALLLYLVSIGVVGWLTWQRLRPALGPRVPVAAPHVRPATVRQAQLPPGPATTSAAAKLPALSPRPDGVARSRGPIRL